MMLFVELDQADEVGIDARISKEDLAARKEESCAEVGTGARIIRGGFFTRREENYSEIVSESGQRGRRRADR